MDANGSDEPLRLDAGPPARKIILPIAAVDASSYGVGELLDIAAVLETDLEGLSRMMATPGIHQARLIVAIAWMLVRRLEPDVTFADARRWRIEVSTEPDPTPGAALTAAPEISAGLGI